jgi:hypothetical protein
MDRASSAAEAPQKDKAEDPGETAYDPRCHGGVTEVHRVMMVIERVPDGSAFLWPAASV